MRFGLHANAVNVRVRLQQGVSAVADANIQLTGGTQASVVSGTVTIDQVTYAHTSDLGSILSRSAPPVQSPTAPSPLLDNMKLDIQVRTSSSLAVQASMTQNFQAELNLRIRRTASQPGVARPGVHHRRPACLFQLDVHGQFEELELSSTWVDQLQSPLRERRSARATCGRERFRSVLTKGRVGPCKNFSPCRKKLTAVSCGTAPEVTRVRTLTASAAKVHNGGGRRSRDSCDGKHQCSVAFARPN